MSPLASSRRRLAAPLSVCALVSLLPLAACGDDAPTAAATTPARTPAERPFAASSPWNTRIDAAPVAADSRASLQLAGSQRTLVTTSAGEVRRGPAARTPGGVVINTQRWTTLVVEGGAATRLRCRQQPCGAEEDRVPATLRIPASAKPDPRYDGWMTVVQGNDAYDLWRARRLEDGTISFAFARHWTMNGSGAGVAGRAAVRGSGLPLFAGLITAEELQRGQIDHALAVALPAPAAGKVVPPASATNGNGAEGAAAAGARLRLRAGVRLASRTPGGRTLTRQQERARDAILVALRRYGAIVVDRATVPSFYARAGIAPEALLGDELSALELEDFEVVRTPTPEPTDAEVAS